MLAVQIEKAPQTGPVWWIPLAVTLVLFGAAAAALATGGESGRAWWRRPADTLSRLTGLPAWCAASVGISLWSLLVALIGFMWDVAWHADLGRDKALFTPPHTMILVGLAGIGTAAVTAIVLATADQASVGLRLGRLRVPWSALPLGLMGLGAMIGFPLDDYWHSTYGIDVTMWSPTHLLMIGGASLAPIATWLMLAEADVPVSRNRWVRQISESLAVSTLVGLSTFQLEFDMGIPQWQALYHPVLIALAMGIGLVAAREALGAGGAIRAAIGFLALRGLIALLVGPVFGLSLPHFPVYLGGALAVETTYLFGARLVPLARVFVSGVLIGTAGVAVEWAWTHVWGLQPWQPRLLASWWVVVVMALAGAFIGSALGRAVAHSRQVMHYSAVGAAFVFMVAMLAVPYPRHGADAVATVSPTQTGPAVPAIDRDGLATVERQLMVSVAVSPSSSVEDADVFRVTAWQGGEVINRSLRAVGGGGYVTDAPIPAGGTWKSLVFLEKGDAVAAVPIDFPRDAQYGLPPIPAPTSSPRVSRFEPASSYLTRESHGGSALPAILAYSALALVAITWWVALVGVEEAMRRRLKPSVRMPGLLGGTS